ncbi:MAG: FG-GAP repeat protein [Opitutaceae bacterium]|jgi:hypothetical protein|nr:FG-GAP repeat protein [Opitutaceae bacterium]
MKTSPKPKPDLEPNHAPLLRQTPFAFAFAIVAAATLANPLSPLARASTLFPTDGAESDYFGVVVSASGPGALVGAYGDDDDDKQVRGAAYYYQGLDGDGKHGTVPQTVKLLASDGAAYDRLGTSVSLSGDNALVGAYTDGDHGPDSGSAYYYHALNTVSGNLTGLTALGDMTATYQTVKLLASDGAEGDYFGYNMVGLSGDNALVGASNNAANGISKSGAAYYYQNLDKVTGNSTGLETLGTMNATNETVKLVASDGVYNDQLGQSVSLWEDNALLSAHAHDYNGENGRGAAYYYQGLTGKTGQETETAKLVASDGQEGDYFGRSVSLSGGNALVGADWDDDNGPDSGSAYYYQGLDAVNPQGGPAVIVTETAKLLASDGAENDYFGRKVALSGANALVGASNNAANGISKSGAAYYYQSLDTVEGNRTGREELGDENRNITYETVKLLASDGAASDSFGASVSLDGDRFVIGANLATVNGVASGKAWAGDIRAFTTLDAGDGAALATDGLSFVSQTDWIIGEKTANNTVTLTAGDTATVTADGKAVYIGQTAGAYNNTLIIEGTLTATTVYVGADGATGNTLRITTDALENLDVGTLYLDVGNFLEFEDADLDIDLEGVAALLDGTTVRVRTSDGWDTLTSDNAATLLAMTGQVDGTWTRFTTFTAPAVPEPAAYAALAGLTLLVYAVALRRPRGNRNRD